MGMEKKLVAGLLALACLAPLAGCQRGEGQQEGSSGTVSGEASQTEGVRVEIPARLEELQAAREKNGDVVAWLQIPNMKVDEAVVQTTDNDYYLRRDVEKKYAYEGCYYLDYESLITGNGSILPQNAIIYGHNLGSPLGVRDDPNGAKFAQLLQLNNQKTAEKIPYVYLTTSSGPHCYEIFAAFYCEAKMTPVPYHYASYTPGQLVELAKDAQARSEFRYPVTVTGTDKLLTLSTCTYKYGSYSQNDQQRYVVMARLVGEGEPLRQRVELTKNPAPKPPSFLTA